MPFVLLAIFGFLPLAANGAIVVRRLLRARDGLVRYVLALDGRMEALGTAVGTLTQSVDLGQRSLGQAVGQFSNDTTSRL